MTRDEQLVPPRTRRFSPRGLSLRGFSAGLVLSAAVGCGGATTPVVLTPTQEAQLFSRPAPNAVPEMDGFSTVGSRVHIDAPPEEVWMVLGENYGQEEVWAEGNLRATECTTGEGGKLGAVRSCHIAEDVALVGGAHFLEKIVRWDPERRYFAFFQGSPAGPVDALMGENWVTADATGSTVTTISYFDLNFPANFIPGMARSQAKRAITEGLIGLKHYIEKGESISAANWQDVIEAEYGAVLEENGV